MLSDTLFLWETNTDKVIQGAPTTWCFLGYTVRRGPRVYVNAMTIGGDVENFYDVIVESSVMLGTYTSEGEKLLRADIVESSFFE